MIIPANIQVNNKQAHIYNNSNKQGAINNPETQSICETLETERRQIKCTRQKTKEMHNTDCKKKRVARRIHSSSF